MTQRKVRVGGMPSSRPPVSRWTLFVRRWGWRAYALPLLSVMTVAVIVQQGAADTHGPAHSAAVDYHRTVASPTRHTAASPTPTSVTVDLAADTQVCSTNGYDQQVIVSIHQEHLWACDGHRQVMSTPVTTGRAGDGTPVGSWRVQGKQTNRYLVGKGYRDFVHFWVPFNGDFGLHDAPWQKVPYGTTDFHNEGSHGCVHVPETMMSWIYHWAVVGKTVVTINR